eukprot:3063367-Prymnesium_polylepis.1
MKRDCQPSSPEAHMLSAVRAALHGGTGGAWNVITRGGSCASATATSSVALLIIADLLDTFSGRRRFGRFGQRF